MVEWSDRGRRRSERGGPPMERPAASLYWNRGQSSRRLERGTPDGAGRLGGQARGAPRVHSDEDGRLTNPSSVNPYSLQLRLGVKPNSRRLFSMEMKGDSGSRLR